MSDKKVGVLLIILVMFLSLTLFVVAQEETEADTEADAIDLAYACLEERVDDCSDLTIDEQAFAILALGDYNSCAAEFLSNSEDEECWPSGNCKLKDTAIALMAFERIGSDTSKIEDWLLNKTKPASDLTWFIEIDANEETTCSIEYGGSQYTITIAEDKTINSAAGTCLSLSDGDYWFKISSTCLENEYKISCDKDFKSTLLYRTQNSPTIHVSQTLNSASQGGETIEEVTFKCFEQGTVCNYEGSLWASLALNKAGHPTNDYKPYLEAFAEENIGLFPSTFLYILTSNNDYYSSILQENFNGKYWQVGTYGKYYNTALAFLAINGQGRPQEDDSKEQLLKDQEEDGCWRTTKDTAFLLYAGWPKGITTGGIPQCIDDSDCTAGKKCTNGFCSVSGSGSANCEDHGKYCTSFTGCENAQGDVLDNFGGCSGSKVCCSQPVFIPSCSAQNGLLCSFDDNCPFSENILAHPGSGICCTGACVPPGNFEEPDVNECADAGGNCKNDCSSGEEKSFSYSCGDVGGSCCLEKKGSSFWLWFFVVLILIVVLLIIFRNKLRLLLFRIKNKFKKGGKPKTTRPIALPASRRPLPPRIRRPLPSRAPPRAPARKPTSKDSAFDDTLKKLREMGK